MQFFSCYTVEYNNFLDYFMGEILDHDGALDKVERIRECSEEFAKMHEDILTKLRTRFGADIVDDIVRNFHEEYQRGE